MIWGVVVVVVVEGGGGVSAHESSPILIESGPINRHGFPLH